MEKPKGGHRPGRKQLLRCEKERIFQELLNQSDNIWPLNITNQRLPGSGKLPWLSIRICQKNRKARVRNFYPRPKAAAEISTGTSPPGISAAERTRGSAWWTTSGRNLIFRQRSRPSNMIRIVPRL